MKEKLARWMQGRYGSDQLSKFLIGFDFVLIILSLFVRKQIFSVIVLAILVYVYFRMFSRNIEKRYGENQKFLEMTSGIRGKFTKWKTRAKQRKTYCFFKCPACSQEVRVPKGKGKIEINCPKCHTKFVKRS